jgi:hypothetical protein
MNLPRDHHYNPRFAQSRWVGSDGMLCAMKLVYGGKLWAKRRAPAATGKQYDLYRIDGVPEANSQDLEVEFMSPLDNNAAVVLDRLITGKPLTSEHRLTWARYLLSLFYRHPEGVKAINTHMADMWREATDALEADFAKMQAGSGLPIRTLAEETARRDPGGVGISTANMIADIIHDSRAVPDIAALPFTVVDVSKSSVSLLTSDRPLVMPLGLDNRACYMALPLSPDQLFVASKDKRYAEMLPKAQHTKVAKAMNLDVVRQAREYVWGSDDTQAAFVKKHIGSLPDREILSDEQRKEILAVARGA